MTGRLLVAFVCALVLLGVTTPAAAHGLAGKRFFPSTLAIDDPFVADELTLPSVLHIKRRGSGDEPPTRETEVSGEWAKRLTPRLGLSLEGAMVHLDPDEGSTLTGPANLEVGLKYQLFTSDEHEALVAVGLGWEVGGTGRKAVEAESFDLVSPALFFGKGLGDLPDALEWLRPLAVTGVVGAEIPTRASTRTVTIEGDEAEVEVERHPNVFRWGAAIEYSFLYLESFVRDLGLPAPVNRMIPLVEIEGRRFLDRGRGGQDVGTVNPGVIWAGKSFQVGVEAVVPFNARSGKNVGVRAMLHFFLDDLFPHTVGRPLFGER